MYGEVNSLVVYVYIALTSYSKYSNVNITDKGNANVRFQPLRREESFLPHLIRFESMLLIGILTWKTRQPRSLGG